MTFPDSNEERMYDNQIAGNPTVNETQVRRAGRRLDDDRAAEALREGDVVGAGTVQEGQTAAERDETATRRGDQSDGEGADTSAQRTPSAQSAAESKSRTGKTQSQRTAEK